MYVDKALRLGAKLVVPVTKVPGQNVSFAVITDPEGNTIGIHKDEGMVH